MIIFSLSTPDLVKFSLHSQRRFRYFIVDRTRAVIIPCTRLAFSYVRHTDFLLLQPTFMLDHFRIFLLTTLTKVMQFLLLFYCLSDCSNSFSCFILTSKIYLIIGPLETPFYVKLSLHSFEIFVIL